MFETQEAFLSEVGHQILNLRTSKQYSRECLAEKADISSKYLYEIEKGTKSCSAYILYRLLWALDIPIADYGGNKEFLQEHEKGILQLRELLLNGFAEKIRSILYLIDEIAK